MQDAQKTVLWESAATSDTWTGHKVVFNAGADGSVDLAQDANLPAPERSPCYVQTPAIPVTPFHFYRLAFTARTESDTYWVAVFFDAAGRELVADVYDRLYATADWAAHRFYVRGLSGAARMRVRFVPGVSPLAVKACAVEEVESSAVVGWADGVALDMPPLRYAPPPDRWARLPRTLKALREGGPLRIVMLGDSIGNDIANSLFETLLMRAAPKSRIEVVTSVRSSSGCPYYQTDNQVQEYVLRHEPALVIIAGISHGCDAEAMRSVIRQIRAARTCDVLVLTGGICPKGPVMRNMRQATRLSDERIVEMMNAFSSRVARMAEEESVGFLDMRQAWDAYLAESGKPGEWFQRDAVHANFRGKQVAGRILVRYLVAVEGGSDQAGPRRLTESDVVFMYPVRDSDTYRAYGATVLAWGGAHTRTSVGELRKLGVHPTGSMWCLTAGSFMLKHHPNLLAAVVRDIAGDPVEVPWLPEGRLHGSPNWWGCFNHPAFRLHLRKQVCKAMAGGADGLHVDDHLGTAHPAISYGGCFCDFCMVKFRTFLLAQPASHLRAAGIESLEGFDYRTLVRRYAATRAEYLSRQRDIPLHREYIEFQLREAAENVREMHELAREIAGRPVSLSANAGLPWPPHMVVTPLLTYLVCEVEQHADVGLARSGNAVAAYRLADALGKPLAGTASGTDWAFVKARRTRNLVTYWIAQSYACGQRLMTPAKAWCYTPDVGTDYYHGHTETYAPWYRFVRRQAALLDGYRAAPAPTVVLFDPPGDFYGGGRMTRAMEALASAGIPFEVRLVPNAWGLGEPPGTVADWSSYKNVVLDAGATLEVAHPGVIRVGDEALSADDWRARLAPPAWTCAHPNLWLFPRIKAGAPPVIHLLNRSYDPARDKITPQKDVALALPAGFAPGCRSARLHRPEGESLPVKVLPSAAGLELVVPELQVWGMVELILGGE